MRRVALWAIAMAALCASGAPPPKSDAEILYDLIARDRYDEAAALLKKRKLANSRMDAKTPVIVAVAYMGSAVDRTKYLNLLLDHGAKVDSEGGNGQTAFQVVSQQGDVRAIRLLVSRGASIHGTDCGGMTALAAAAEWGQVEAARALLSLGADINHAGRSREMSCMSLGDLWQGIAVAAVHGARGLSSGTPRKTYWQQEMEMPALSYALRQGKYEMAQFLLRQGADSNARSREWDSTPLMFLARDCAMWDEASIDPAEMAKVLIRAGADVNAKNRGGATALDLAIEPRGCAVVVDVLRRPVDSLSEPPAPRPFRSLEMLSQWVTGYYRTPEPRRVGEAISAASRFGQLDPMSSLSALHVGFLAGALGREPSIGKELGQRMAKLPGHEQAILSRGIWYSGSPGSQQLLDDLAPTLLGGESAIDARIFGPAPAGPARRLTDIPLDEGPWVIAALRRHFLATGDDAPIVRMNSELRPLDGQQPWGPKQMLAHSAAGALVSFAYDHPLVLEICRTQQAIQPKPVAGVLAHVIAQVEGELKARDELARRDAAR